MTKGFRYSIRFCAECGKGMGANWIKKHLMFYHNFAYTQESPSFPVRRIDESS